MIDHMGFRVRDLAAARRFYDACARALDLQTADNTDESFVLGYSKAEPLPFIWIGTALPAFWSPAHVTSNSPIHLAFKAKNRAAVDAFHRAALAAGGTDNGQPGPRGPAEMKYYAAFVLDPDGNNVEAGVRE
jgi:catechol 2,3-dioxygenase-like lactoylglutathione lyase family enzyme